MDRSTLRTVMSWRTLALAVIALTLAAPALRAQSASDIQKAVDAAYAKYKGLQEGKNADYIPALAKVDPNLFGIAVVTPDGKVYSAGDVKTEVSIQSISKVFTMMQVIQEQGLESIEKRIGVDATGARFNSIIAVEAVKTTIGAGAPEMNPLVNPGESEERRDSVDAAHLPIAPDFSRERRFERGEIRTLGLVNHNRTDHDHGDRRRRKSAEQTSNETDAAEEIVRRLAEPNARADVELQIVVHEVSNAAVEIVLGAHGPYRVHIVLVRAPE